MHHRLHLLILSVLLSIGLFTTTVSAFESITIDFYYSEVCGSCIEALDNVIHPIEEKFKENITILYKDVNINITFRDEMINYRLSYPSVVINDKTKIPTQNLTLKNTRSSHHQIYRKSYSK
jgi:hypothetical protein